MSGSNHSHTSYSYDPLNTTEQSQAYYGYDYSYPSTNQYSNSANAATYEGYDYSTYSANSYYYPTTSTNSVSTASTATVVEAPPSIISPSVSISAAATSSNKTGSTHQQERGITSISHGPLKDEMLGVSTEMLIGNLNKQQNSKKKQKTIIRAAGGEVWEDPTLLEWDLNDFRLFCGDLGNEVTDEVLYKAFSRYSSIQKAKVVRDKRTGKSKGYGFVSFKDADEFVKAWKEMNGKYVGNRPIKLRKSTWKERNMDVKSKKHHPYK
ncbi:11405_t:CDS:2 [Acaulospora morrowiae]|uniref:11405_t:CDS:1 n=1 Tax=Acaulospora morrowiae TaxID=94023 RepID=A0A9N9IG97_9GLOM|nr:11405_t:CDS:2 [Acaulospora morrowiae]